MGVNVPARVWLVLKEELDRQGFVIVPKRKMIGNYGLEWVKAKCREAFIAGKYDSPESWFNNWLEKEFEWDKEDTKGATK